MLRPDKGDQTGVWRFRICLKPAENMYWCMQETWKRWGAEVLLEWTTKRMLTVLSIRWDLSKKAITRLHWPAQVACLIQEVIRSEPTAFLQWLIGNVLTLTIIVYVILVGSVIKSGHQAASYQFNESKEVMYRIPWNRLYHPYMLYLKTKHLQEGWKTCLAQWMRVKFKGLYWI